MIIATHDGSFHADETTACAILTYIYENSTIMHVVTITMMLPQNMFMGKMKTLI